jgi:hypothetical protein
MEVEDEPVVLLLVSSMVDQREPILVDFQTPVSIHIVGMLDNFHGFSNLTFEKVIFFCQDLSFF